MEQCDLANDLNIKLPRGMQHHGGNIRFDFAFDKKRYRVTTKLKVTEKGIENATKLLICIKNDLDKNEFYIDNYKRMFYDIAPLEPLDVNYALKQSQKPMSLLLEEQLQRYELACNNKILRYSSLVGYKSIFKKYLIPYFGESTINEITSFTIEEFIASIKLSRKRISSILAPLRVIMRRAKKADIIQKDPFDSVDDAEIKLHSTVSNYEIEPFNSTEKKAIINQAEGQIRNLIQFAFWTGMRIGEIFALTWNDIDFNNEVVYVNKTKSLDGIRPPKTKAGIREVELTSLALEALKAQHKFTGNLTETVFHNPYTNQAWSKSSVLQRYWQKILANANVKYRNIHQMRHTFISYMLFKGNPPEILYKIVGHENTEMIYRVYGKYIKGERTGKKLVC